MGDEGDEYPPLWARRLDAVMVGGLQNTESTRMVVWRWFVHFSCCLQVNSKGSILRPSATETLERRNLNI